MTQNKCSRDSLAPAVPFTRKWLPFASNVILPLCARLELTPRRHSLTHLVLIRTAWTRHGNPSCGSFSRPSAGLFSIWTFGLKVRLLPYTPPPFSSLQIALWQSLMYEMDEIRCPAVCSFQRWAWAPAWAALLASSPNASNGNDLLPTIGLSQGIADCARPDGDVIGRVQWLFWLAGIHDVSAGRPRTVCRSGSVRPARRYRRALRLHAHDQLRFSAPFVSLTNDDTGLIHSLIIVTAHDTRAVSLVVIAFEMTGSTPSLSSAEQFLWKRTD
jgi:hypothetical protein